MKVGASLTAAVVALLLPAGGAQANEIAGATYNGTVGGSSMSFTVSPDGLGITSFNVAGPLAGDTCTFSGLGATYVTPVPIANHAFADTTPPMTFSGSFPGAQSAQGTFRMKTSGFPASCDTGDLAWTATTTSLPPDTTAPAVNLGGRTTQKVLAQRGVLVVAGCPAEACTVTAQGTVSVPAKAKVFKFTPVTTQIGQGGKATLKLKLSKPGLKAVKRALKAGRKLRAKVTVTVKDAAGNTTTGKRTIGLKL